jgi:hypothetical protein
MGVPMNRVDTATYPRKRWMICSVVAAVLISVPVVDACSWSYLIWGIRTKPADPLFRFVRNGRAGYIDSSGKVVIQPTFPKGDTAAGEFHEGLVAVEDDRGYRYMDRSGAVVFRTDAWLAFDFSEGLAPAARYAGFPEDKFPKWGFIDRTGRFTIGPQYYWVDPFSEGLARVSVSSEVGSTGYIDAQGNFTIAPNLTYGASFHEGLAAVIIDGPCRITNSGSCARSEFKPTQPQATYDCRYAFIDKSGEPISDLRFDDAQDFSEGLAPVRIGQLWGFVDRSGYLSISPKFAFAEPFSEGLAAVRENDKTGFIDHSGNFVIAPKFESADGFSDGRALVSENNGQTFMFIDKAGKAAFPGKFMAAASFAYGLAPVALTGGLKGVHAWINTSGKPVFTYTGQ